MAIRARDWELSQNAFCYISDVSEFNWWNNYVMQATGKDAPMEHPFLPQIDTGVIDV